MALKPILKYPDPSLRQPTRPVALPVAPEVAALVADMIETMYGAAGAGRRHHDRVKAPAGRAFRCRLFALFRYCQ